MALLYSSVPVSQRAQHQDLETEAAITHFIIYTCVLPPDASNGPLGKTPINISLLLCVLRFQMFLNPVGNPTQVYCRCLLVCDLFQLYIVLLVNESYERQATQ